NREVQIQDKRYLMACEAARSNRLAYSTRANQTAAGRMLQASISSKDQTHRWNDASANRTGLLEFIRTPHAQQSSALALDVQALALSSGTSRSTVPLLRQLLSALRRHAGSQQVWGERRREVVQAFAVANACDAAA